jgi:hypothetical protein
VLVLTFPDSDPPLNDVVGGTQTETQWVETYYAEQSYGRFTWQGDAFGVLTIPRPVNPTSAVDARTQVATAAREAAIAAGIDLSPYQSNRFVYVLPQTEFIGGGYGDHSGVWIARWPTRVMTPGFQPLVHELGHHFWGLPHARGMVCSDGTPLGSNGGTCSTHNQGDSLDPMGHGYLSFNPVVKHQLGWLDASQIIQAGPKGGTYTLTPYGTPGGAKVLTFQGGTNKNPITYWVHYRQPVGADARHNPFTEPANIFSGALVTMPGFFSNGSTLLKMTPSNDHDLDTPALEVGNTWCESIGQRIAITPMSATDSGLTVRITVGRCR